MLAADVSFLPVVDENLNYVGTVKMKGLATACLDAAADATIEAWIETDSAVAFADGDLITELEAIINSSYDGIFITDGDGTVIRLNEAYERITGVKAGQVTGKNMAALVKEGVYDQSVTLLVLQRGESVTINQTVKPTNKHILVTGNPVFNERGQIIRVVTNVRDVTELVNLQNKLSKTVAETLKYQTELSLLRSLQLKEADIIYRSTAMASVVELAVKVADVNSNVLITGESGTGKELVAKLIHRQGKGDTKPFIKINCGAIPDNLLESELFGYAGGAFTGARKEGKPGLFELAHKGTLFLDEIGEMPPVLQVKLLRAIQEKTITRVGGVSSVAVNVRIIAATHRDLSQMVKKGTFREDLFYRLMVVPIHMPPLREHKGDIPLLIKHFVDKLNREFGFAKTISPQVVDKLIEYSWPGNVRELENLIERLIVTSPADEIKIEQIPDSIAKRKVLSKGSKLKMTMEQIEAHFLAEAFKEYQSWPKVAEELGMNRSTIFRKASKYKLLDK
ncbi:pas fold [Lucifera butyrica]|uniref:HTH-type transcriptional regulatory protein TyrR n=2 Tax=Lucifera butyrica TaxID=1351585 RepID=A0A498R8V0_9FIRM|nr:pas fold [Lucifera butyrica]